MADFSDVTAALQAAIVNLAYPNGTGVPSALGVEIQVMEGWPIPAALDAIAGRPNATALNPISLVSIYPVPSSTGDAGTPMDNIGVVKSKAVAGIVFTVDAATLTISGVAAGIENIVAVVNRSTPYGVQAKAGDTAVTVATALFAQIEPAFPSSVLDLSDLGAPTIDVVGAHDLAARVGTTGIIQRVTHRERQQVRIIVWSSNPVDRNKVGAPIGQMLKAKVVLDLPDGTSSIFSYATSNWSDDPERIGLFRRDVIFSATCDSVEEIEAVEVTAMGFQTTLPGGAILSSSS